MQSVRFYPKNGFRMANDTFSEDIHIFEQMVG